MTATRKDGHATGMAAEFFVMSQLFRLKHAPALTLGNAKSIDILVRSESGKHYDVSVKAVRGGGKWGVSSEDESNAQNRIYVFLLYKNFEDITTSPIAYVIPATEVEPMKSGWHQGWALYYSSKANRPKNLEDYREAWDRYFK